MTFRKFGLSAAMTVFALLAALSTAESAQAGRSSGGHHGGHHGGWHHKQKTCFSWYGGRRCFYR